VVQSWEKIILAEEPHRLGQWPRELSGRFSFLTAHSAAEVLHILDTVPDVAVVICPTSSPSMSGMKLLAGLRQRRPEVRRILIAKDGDEVAAAAVGEGRAFRTIPPDADAGTVAEVLDAAVEEFRFITNGIGGGPVDPRSISASPDRARQSFLAMMNHELRTPLNHILGFSALLEQRCKQRGEIDALEYLAYIRESGHSLLRTITRILEIARLSAGEISEKPRVFDVVGMVAEEVRHCRAAAVLRHISMSFDAPADPLHVEASQHELAQAVAELLDNAIKFNRPNGHVSVAVKGTAEDVAIRIADTGAGMAQSDVQRVLNALGQKEDPLNQRLEGIGLGLTLTALAAQMNNGSLAVDSRSDHGTTVVLRLKRASAPSQAAKIA
jgi:signal transduction histidine kinase